MAAKPIESIQLVHQPHEWKELAAPVVQPSVEFGVTH
jgi:hypothetical protein